MATSTKLLGDAGEHYALSQFSFGNGAAMLVSVAQKLGSSLDK